MPIRLRAALPRAKRSKMRSCSLVATPGPGVLDGDADPVDFACSRSLVPLAMPGSDLDAHRAVAVVVGVVDQVAEDTFVADLVDRDLRSVPSGSTSIGTSAAL